MLLPDIPPTPGLWVMVLFFRLNKKWDIDFGTSISYNDYNNKTDNRSAIRKISSAQTLTDNLNRVANDGSSANFRIGINGKLKIDSLGSEWSNDLFYNYTQNKAEQVFNTLFYIPLSTIAGGDGTQR